MDLLSCGKSKDVQRLFRLIGEDKKISMNSFYVDCLSRYYEQFDSKEEIEKVFSYEDISSEDQEYLREYSGYNFRNINNSLRKNWNYEENGSIKEQERFLKDSLKIQSIIEENAVNEKDFTVYRGVRLDLFLEYGISSLIELKAMENQYLYERGFISTSLIEKDSFFQKENDFGLCYNVQIKYLIPQEFQDGIYLDDTLSYSPNQNEYLINSGNLAKVVSVDIQDDCAFLTAIMIPKEIYDEYYYAKKNNMSVK